MPFPPISLLRRAVLAPAALLLAIAPAHAIDIQRVVSPGGIEAWLVEDHKLPMISVALSFRGGGALDREGREGTADLVSGLLDEGAGDLASQAFQRRLEDLAVRLDFDASAERFTGTMQTLAENRDAAFDLLRLALTEPRFDEEPVERIRRQAISGVLRDLEQPARLASRAWQKAAFPEHPYGRPTSGTPDSLSAVTRDDLVAFVHDALARDGLKIGVTGDVTAAELGPLLDSTFGALPATGAPPVVEPEEPAGSGDVIVVERNVPQAAVQFGQEGVERDDPDYYALHVVNHILGGNGFTSRLTEAVREKRGLTYGIYSYLYPRDAGGLIMGGFSTANATAGEAIALMREEWRRIGRDGITAEELEDAKRYLTGSFPLRFDSSLDIAQILVAVQQEKLGIDYLDRRNDYIEAVTLEDANRVARKWFDPDRLLIVVTGKPEGVEATRPPPAGAG